VVEAARIGAGEVGRAVIASTMTTVCVFVPIVFVEGVAGQLFGDQALTVTFSLSVSLIVALTLIPMLASRQFGGEVVEETAPQEKMFFLKRWVSTAFFYVSLGVAKLVKFLGYGVRLVIDAVLYLPIKGFNLVFGAITRAYPITLDKVLARPVPTLAITIALLAGSLLLFGQLGQELVPELIQGQFYANLELPPGTHLDVSSRRISNIEDVAESLEGVVTVYGVAGTSNEQGGIAGELRENIGQITLTLSPPIDREKEDAMMERLRPALERDGDMKYRFGRPTYFSFKTPIEVEIRGFNLKLLRRLADDLVARMHEIPGLADIKSSTEGGYPELQIRFNRERLATLGFNVNDAAALIRSTISSCETIILPGR
jgi:HAE1 family hydrophobic/amphiphilic exporter-1